MKRFIYYIVLFLPVLVFGQNYVKNTIYKTESTATFSSIPDPEDGIVNITYFDGLGRPIQQIAHKQSASGKDIITHIEYDEFGRQVRDYLPYTTTSANPNFRTDAQSRTISYYETKYDDEVAFSEKLIENSPLGRVLKQAGTGEVWQLDQGHTIDFEYSTNTTNEVKLFKAITSTMSNGAYTATLGNSSGNVYYGTNELYKTVIIDENGAKTEEFKDKQGRVVLKRAYNVKNPQNINRHDTYYVYDIYGNLTYVIPPKAVDLGTISSNVLNNLCYQYRYDSRNRLVEKKIPGRGNPTSSSTSGWEYIVYDKLDRVIAIGPALSPFEGSSATGWLITKYDVLGRVVYTGWSTINNATTSVNRSTLQTFMNSASVLNENKLATDNSINGVTLRYSNLVYPGLSPHILTVNYYDDYSYPNAPTSNPTEIEDQPLATNVKGLPTGSWVRVLTTSSEYLYELTYTLYDQKARPIRTYQRNHLEGFTQNDIKLDFVGTPLKTITTHKYDSSIPSPTTITEEFEYSDQGRLEKHTHQINGGLVETLSHNTYNELGQLDKKKVGRTATTPLQTVDYKYNIRGWLTDINNVDALSDDLFAFKINYNDVAFDAQFSQYNGNISETYWKTSSDNVLRKYTYYYDAMNRLEAALYAKPLTSDYIIFPSSSYDELVNYDKNGNIISLNRMGDLDNELDYIQIDQLAYTYDDGNRLMKVTDTTNHPEGFKDGTNTGNDYAYDIFGNLTQDLNKGIPTGGIKYNHLNLPKEISFSGIPTRKITYLYNALGKKVRKVVTNNTTVTTTDYQSGFLYENQGLKYFVTAEGYVNHSLSQGNSVYNYIYNYTDHLGNNRLSYTLNQTTGNVVIYEQNHYYPFGLKHEKYGVTAKQYVGEGDTGYYTGNVGLTGRYRRNEYQMKFNHREWQDELNLNWTSMDYRNYDNTLGRFHSMDRLAELAPGITPYRFAFNNPNYWSDPTGLFEDKKSAMDHIDAYGLKNAKVDYNENGYWQITSGGFTFYQSGNDLVLRYLDTSTGGVTVNADGVSTIDEIYISQSTLRGGALKGGADFNWEGGADVWGGYNRKNGFDSMLNNPINSCHHTTTFSQGSVIDWSAFNLNDRQSGYVQYGGAMRSDFIGSSVGKNGVIYGAYDNIFAPGANINTRIQMLRYIMDTKTGLGIGSALIESLRNEPSINLQTFNYFTTDTIWVTGGRVDFRFYKQIQRKGYIINNDTLW